MINYFKAAERTLAQRGNLDRALENLERRRDKAIRRGAPKDLKTIDHSGAYVSGGGVNDVLADRLEVAELNRAIERTRDTIEEIDRVLAQLNAADSDLLRAWYIEHKSKEEIAALTNYSSTSTLYDLRNKAVAAFAILYYGAGALASM